jgi:hypothetical protein
MDVRKVRIYCFTSGLSTYLVTLCAWDFSAVQLKPQTFVIIGDEDSWQCTVKPGRGFEVMG